MVIKLVYIFFLLRNEVNRVILDSVFRNVPERGKIHDLVIMVRVMVFNTTFNNMCIYNELYLLRFINSLSANLTKGHVSLSIYLNRITVFNASFNNISVIL